MENNAFTEVDRVELDGIVEFAIKDAEVVYYTCQNSFSLYQYNNVNNSSHEYIYPIQYFSVNNGNMLVVLKMGLRYEIHLKSSEFSMIFDCGDIPYWFDIYSKTIALYFQTKVMILNQNKDILDIKNASGLNQAPRVVKTFKGRIYAITDSIIYVSKSGTEWSVFKQNLVICGFDPALYFLTGSVRDFVEYNQNQLKINYKVVNVLYSGPEVFLVTTAGIDLFSAGKCSRLLNYDKVKEVRYKDILGKKEEITKSLSNIGYFEKKRIIKEIIGDYLPKDTAKFKNSTANMNKVRNLKDFLSTETRFETFEYLKCAFLVSAEELLDARESKNMTFKHYQNKLEEFDKVKARMIKREAKLNFTERGVYSSPKMLGIINFNKDDLLENQYTQDLISSQKLLVQKAMKDLEEEGLKEEKLLSCTFEKINNEVISLEYNVDKLRAQMSDFLTVSRSLNDLGITKLISFIAKGRPKFKRSPTSLETEKGFYDFIEDSLKSIKLCCSKRCHLLTISALDFRFTNEKLEISFFPAELVIQIQKQIRHLEEQYGCDKEDILGIEHGINIVDWEYKILTIFRNSLKSDYMECSSLKPKKAMIRGFEELPKIANAFDPESIIKPMEKILQINRQRNSNLEESVEKLKKKKDRYMERSKQVTVISKPEIDLQAFSDLKRHFKLKNEHDTLLEEQMINIRLLSESIERSRPSL